MRQREIGQNLTKHPVFWMSVTDFSGVVRDVHGHLIGSDFIQVAMF
jgi:hypothetical protein